ncbi:MAG: glycosyl hydrolase family 18 protein [Minisyncoccia bacterium]
MRRTAILIVLFFFLSPSGAHAAGKATFEVAGWIPYWRAATGTVDTIPHMKDLKAVMPFGYIVQNDGSLHDAFNFSATSSTSTANILTTVARAEKTLLIPTVMWSNSSAISNILGSTKSRIALEDSIAALVKEHDFDGINIDFENKPASTRKYFSLFLKGLYARMGEKLVYCSIEPRTPPSSAFELMPPKFEYANDYVAINKYCDRVQIMTYDQGAIDLKLNAAANSKPYIPIADTKWVEKVITLASKTINKNKLMIGIATYGYEYDLVPLRQGYRYEINWAFNPRYATELATSLGVTPTRNSAGEMSFVYQATTTPAVAGVAAAFPPLRIVWWSDAQAVSDKIRLAKKLGVRGVAIFKFDGGQDPKMWDVLPHNTKK